MIVVETTRLRVRTFVPDDAAFVLRLVNEPAFIANIHDKGLRTLEDARRFLESGPWTAGQPPGHGQFVVELRDSGVPIGICGLLRREALPAPDIGYAILGEFWNQGYAYEAAAGVMEYGRTTLGLGTILALTSAENAASIRVLEKLGLRFGRIIYLTADDPGTRLYS